MSLGLLGSYVSDSDSEGGEKGEGGGTSVEGFSEIHMQPPRGSDGDSCEPDMTATSKVVVTGLPTHRTGVTGNEVTGNKETDEKQRTDSPVVSYGLSGEDLIGSDSSSSQSSDEEREECEDEDEVRERSPLPLPVLDGSEKVASSVFSNPYREAEEARLAVLKQHVELSHHEEPREKQRRRWSKRGKFRGRHSQDQSSESGGLSSGSQFWDDRDSPAGQGGVRQKHRSGVGESLQPPKKYMKIHQKIQSVERPWTR